MIDFLIESTVSEEIKKSLVLHKIEKVTKLEDIFTDVRKLPDSVFETLKDSIFKLKGSLKILSTETMDYAGKFYIFFFNTHLMLCDMVSIDQQQENQHKLIYKDLIPLNLCKFVLVRDTDIIKNVFQIMTDKTNYMLQADSSYSKSRWANLFEEEGLLKKVKPRRKFCTNDVE
ncbi:MAG: hypothetical protein MHPSP_000889 [Paramarteilia canceri]